MAALTHAVEPPVGLPVEHQTQQTHSQHNGHPGHSLPHPVGTVTPQLLEVSFFLFILIYYGGGTADIYDVMIFLNKKYGKKNSSNMINSWWKFTTVAYLSTYQYKFYFSPFLAIQT